jgi:ferritin-like metal-binding protein YciE
MPRTQKQTKSKRPKQMREAKLDLATLKDLFLIQMKDLYDTEHQIIKALPAVMKKVASPELKQSLADHLEETKEHARRLEMIYKMIDMKPKRQPSLGMKGLIDDGKEVMGMKSRPELMDAAIIANARHIEHQEMAGYMATMHWAELLALPEAVKLMQRTLQEEEKADAILATLGDEINMKAAVL